METHLYELYELHLYSSVATGHNSLIDEEIHNTHSYEKRLKTVKAMRLTKSSQKTLMYRTRKLFSFLVTQEKNIVREVLVLNKSVLVKTYII